MNLFLMDDFLALITRLLSNVKRSLMKWVRDIETVNREAEYSLKKWIQACVLPKEGIHRWS